MVKRLSWRHHCAGGEESCRSLLSLVLQLSGIFYWFCCFGGGAGFWGFVVVVFVAQVLLCCFGLIQFFGLVCFCLGFFVLFVWFFLQCCFCFLTNQTSGLKYFKFCFCSG